MTIIVNRNRWFVRLFSILLMIVIIVITLSTATFAWFSSNNYVNLSDIEFKAGTSQEGQGDLAISWDHSKINNYTITFNNEIGLQPMIPVNEGVVGETEYTEFCNFNKATQVYDSLLDKILVRLSDNKYCNPVTLKSNEYDETFYLINKSSYPMEVYLKYFIEGDNITDNFRCAFFCNNILQGIMSNNSDIYYGNLINNKDIYDTPIMINAYRESDAISFVIQENNYVSCKAVAWFDGVNMRDEDGNKKVQFTMSFYGDVI